MGHSVSLELKASQKFTQTKICVGTIGNFAWHTADLPLQMRVVAHADCEQISREMAHAWAAYIRTGSPSTEELPWPAFTATGRETMVLDTPCRVENDPTRPFRETLA